MKKILSLVFLVILLLLTACSSEGNLRTNPEMQEMLEGRESGGAIYYPLDNKKQICSFDHAPAWKVSERGHYEVCRRCGELLTPEEEHEAITFMTDGYLIIDEQLCAAERGLCKCRLTVEVKYTPID